VPWYTLTWAMLIIQLVLTMLSSFLKADFVTLTCVTAGLLFVHDARNLGKQTFRKLVALVFLSLIYDVIWFSFYDEELENIIDGNIQPRLRKIFLLINYFSFMFRVSFQLIRILDLIAARPLERLFRLRTAYIRIKGRINYGIIIILKSSKKGITDNRLWRNRA